MKAHAAVQTASNSASATGSNFFLQRKCACGGPAGLSDSCEKCSEKKLLGHPLQAKLVVGSTDDPLEREADRVAERVLSSGTRDPMSSAPVHIQRDTETQIERSGITPASVDVALASNGMPLESTLRRDMEARFGHDFSTVRVHADTTADRSARDVGAMAYTAGHHLVFGGGRYDPTSYSGRRLLAHELTHVLQQRRSTPILQRAPDACKSTSRAKADEVLLDKAQKAASSMETLQALYLELKRTRACFSDFDEAAFLALVTETTKLYKADTRKLAEKGHPKNVKKDDRKLAWAESLKPFAGYFLSGFDTANRLLTSDNKRKIGGALAPDHKPFSELADKQGESANRLDAQKAFSQASVLVFSGHQYAQYKLPGVWNTGDWNVTMDVRGIQGPMPNVRLVVSTSCATLCKEAYEVWKGLFPNAVFLGAARSTPLKGSVLANAFVKNLPKDLLFDAGGSGTSGAISAWKSAVEATQSSAVLGGVLDVAAGQVELWNGDKWETKSASSEGNKCKTKDDWSANVPDPRAVAAAASPSRSGAVDDPLDALGPEVELPRVTGSTNELSTAPKVDQIKVISSKTNAFSGFPVVGEVDLNGPTAYNDTKSTGTCVNIHQMQFHLSKGDPTEVKLKRKVVRVASAGGKQSTKGEKDKPADDGPSAPTVVHPKDSSSVVVADSPGFVGRGDASKREGVFPVRYDADFELHAIDPIEPRLLATLKYSVNIAKNSFDEASPVNTITEKSRRFF